MSFVNYTEMHVFQGKVLHKLLNYVGTKYVHLSDIPKAAKFCYKFIDRSLIQTFFSTEVNIQNTFN